MEGNYGNISERLSEAYARTVFDELLKQLRTLRPDFRLVGGRIEYKGWHTRIPLFATGARGWTKLAVNVCLGFILNHTDQRLSKGKIGIYKGTGLIKHRSMHLQWDAEKGIWVWDEMKLKAKIWEVYGDEASPEQLWYMKAIKLQAGVTVRICKLLNVEPNQVNFPVFPCYEIPVSEIGIQVNYDWGYLLIRYDDPMFILVKIRPNDKPGEELSMYRGDIATVIDFISSSWRHNS